MSDFFKRYLLPGFIFQSVIIGGGYATGRELIEFFMPAGPWGGILGMCVAMAVWSAVLAVSFELVRLTRSYDYKSFFGVLLGRGWIVFEIAYLLLLVLILSVLGAASGEVASNAFGLPPLAGTLALMGIIGLLVFFGSSILEQVTALLALALYAVYILFILWCLWVFGDRILANFSNVPVGGGWFTGGLTYAGYNVACIPAVFFCVRHMTRRREAFAAGTLAGPIAMIPGILFYVALMGYYPQIGEETLPASFLLGMLQAPWFEILFQLVLFGTLVDTGAPLLHSINERVAKAYEARGRLMPRALRPALSLSVMAVSVFAASAVGLVGLIAKGYGLLTWVFIAVLVVPVLTIGVWKIKTLSRGT